MQKEECIEIFERYIQNLASDEEIRRLSNWIKSNQDISLWLEKQIMATSSTIDSEVQLRMLRNIEIESNYSQVVNKQSNRRFELNRWMRVAAILILPIFTATTVYFYMSRNESLMSPLIVAVEKGQKANITLPDGSKAWLNSESKLTYSSDFNIEKRELQLEGEAYFEVFHNPQKPFVVKCSDMSVEALGTSFVVKAYLDDNLTSSILMKGKIRVTTPDGNTILEPNNRVVYDKSTHKMTQSGVSNAINYTGWINNELRFENESLSEIAKSIERIYNVEIIFATENIKNQRYTGTVNNNNLLSILNTITLSSPISFQIDKQQVTLYEDENMFKR